MKSNGRLHDGWLTRVAAHTAAVVGALAVALAVALAGVVVSASGGGAGAATQSQSQSHTASAASSGAGATSPVRTLLVEPAAGLTKIYTSIASAKKTIDLEMYELVDTRAETLLAQAAARGVKVRVILDKHLEGSRNAPAYGYLTSHHVAVHWAPSAFAADHEKAMVVDTREVWVMTLNLTSAYYANTRDFAVLDTIPADVHAVATTFNDDFSAKSGAPSNGTDLVWSPTNASSVLLSLIGAAHSSLWVENEEMSDAAIVSALGAAARRGVAVHVVMNDTSEYATDFDSLVGKGVKVGTYPGDPGLYIHAKAVVVDPGRSSAEAFVGSENFSLASLLHNRELGLTTRNGALVNALASTIEHDFAGAAPWHAPAQTASAWCAASAQPSNDGYAGDYAVDIRSNQPDQEATASDANDTYSHETDAAGSASITLWHQSAGEHITVTVGSAHCSATA